MATYAYPSRAEFGPGMSVGYLVADASDNILAARTTSGITETPDPLVPGVSRYSANVTLDETWAGRILWDDGVGTTSNDWFDAVPVVETFTRAPLKFYYYRAGVLSDTGANGQAITSVTLNDGNGAAVRDATTNAILVAAPVSMTHDGVGEWSYTLDDLYRDYSVRYFPKVLFADATTETFLLEDLGPTTHYSSIPQIRAKLGWTNAEKAGNPADLENEADVSVVVPQSYEKALTQSDNRVNRKLLGAGVTLPLETAVTADPYVMAQIRDAAMLYASGYLLKLKEDQVNGPTPSSTTNSAGDALIAEGDALMDTLLPVIVDLTVEEEEASPGTFEFVPIVRADCDVTGDENFRPIWWY